MGSTEQERSPSWRDFERIHPEGTTRYLHLKADHSILNYHCLNLTYVLQIREDGKMDIALRPVGYDKVTTARDQ